MSRTGSSKVCNRSFQLPTSLDAVGIVTHDIGSDVTALNNESINVMGSNFGIIMPSREELMMDEGRRDRVGEVETLESGEYSKDTI